jgi:hypothetical protein
MQRTIRYRISTYIDEIQRLQLSILPSRRRLRDTLQTIK